MKNQPKVRCLPVLFLLLGGAGWLTRLAQYRFAVDEKGLLRSTHPLMWLLVALVIGAAVLLLLTKKEEKPLSGAAWLPALGAFAMAAGLVSAATGIELLRPVEKIYPILGMLAAAGQLWAGISHLRRRAPFFACDCAAALFLGLYAVTCYNGWSGNPHFHQYFFFTGGLILLALTACCRSAFAAGLGWGKHHTAFALGAAFLCLTGIPASGETAFLLCGGIWAALGLYRPAAKDAEG